MPANYTYPGVYVEEIPSGVRTIVGVSTSVTAFVGRTAHGMVNESKLITSFGDFERDFGGLDRNFPLSYAVRDFYLNGGSLAVIVRLTKTLTTQQEQLVAEKLIIEQLLKDVEAAADGQTANKVVTDAISDQKNKKAIVKLQEIQTKVTALGSLTPASPPPPAVEPVPAAPSASPAAAPTAVTKDAIVNLVKAAHENYANVKDDSAKASTESTTPLRLKATSPGEWGNALRVRLDTTDIDTKVEKEFKIKPGMGFNLFVEVVGDDGGVISSEAYRYVCADDKEHLRYVGAVLERESALVTVPEDLKLTNNPVTEATKKGIPLIGGMDGDGLSSTDYQGSKVKKEGIYALADADFNLLCIPPDKFDGNTDTDVYVAAAKYCMDRRAMLIADPVATWGKSKGNAVETAKAGFQTFIGALGGPAARYAMMYFPRVMQRDPLKNGDMGTFAACGIIAGVMARTDATRGVWKAPAGIDAAMAGVPALQVALNDLENGQLNPLGLNCLRNFPVIGNVIWGTRTLRGADVLADDYKYVPIRRLANYIEESLYRGTKWVVFEPNDEPLWAQIRLNIGAFMQDLFRQGAFQGSTPREAYLVKCDKETTTQFDIDRGIVNIVVGFAPLKPAEFVVLKIQQLRNQA